MNNLFILVISPIILIYGIYYIDKTFLDSLIYRFLDQKYSPPREWPRLHSIQQNIYTLLPNMEHLKVKQNTLPYNDNEYLIVQLVSDISATKKQELESTIKGIIANHHAPYTIDYTQIRLINGGWFALFKLAMFEEATFNQNARANDPQPQEEFHNDDRFIL